MHPLQQSATLEIQSEAHDLPRALEAHHIISIPEEPNRRVTPLACPEGYDRIQRQFGERYGCASSTRGIGCSPRKSLSAPRELRVEIIPKFRGRPEEQTGPHPESSESQDSCAICLDDLKVTEEEDVWSTSCQHAFHVNCLRNHFKTQRNNALQETCPLCRRLLLKEAESLSDLEEKLTMEVHTQQADIEDILCYSIFVVIIATFTVCMYIYGDFFK